MILKNIHEMQASMVFLMCDSSVPGEVVSRFVSTWFTQPVDTNRSSVDGGINNKQG